MVTWNTGILSSWTITGCLLPSGAMMVAFNHRAGTTLVLGVERAGAPLVIKIVVAKQTN